MKNLMNMKENTLGTVKHVMHLLHIIIKCQKKTLNFILLRKKAPIGIKV